MNTMKFSIKYISILLVLCCIPQFVQAQFDIKKLHFTGDWQLNAPVSTDFADKMSGWGANFELTYDVAPHWKAGAFVAYQTSHKYVDRQVIDLSPTESLSTDQQRSAYQVPFGVMVSYSLLEESHFEPYVSAKTGAMFARNTTYFGTSGLFDKGYGFYVSPEIGCKIYPMKDQSWGFHIAGYYSYATNKTQTLTHEIKGQSNLGLRLGITF